VQIGHGMKELDLERLGAAVGYTLDAELEGDIQWETFSADKATVQVGLIRRRRRRRRLRYRIVARRTGREPRRARPLLGAVGDRRPPPPFMGAAPRAREASLCRPHATENGRHVTRTRTRAFTRAGVRAPEDSLHRGAVAGAVRRLRTGWRRRAPLGYHTPTDRAQTRR